MAPLHPGLLLELFAVGYIALRPGSLARAGVFSTWGPRLVLALAVFAMMAAPFGLSAGGSLAYFLSVYSRVLILFVLLVATMRGPADVRLYMWGYLAGAAFLCYLSIFVVNVVPQYGSAALRLDDDITHMFDPNDIGVINAIAIPIALILMQTSKRMGRLASGTILFGVALTFARSGSRGGLIGLGAVSAALLILANRVSVLRRVSLVVGVVTALALAAPAGYWKQMSTIMDPGDDYNVTSQNGRMQIWKRGMGYLEEYPLSGVGLGNFPRAEGTISVKARHHTYGTGIWFAAPHNSWVQVSAELGIPGGIMFTCLVLGGMWSLVRLRRRLPSTWIRGSPDERFLYIACELLPASYIGFAFTAFFLSFAYLDPIYILTAFTAALTRAVSLRLAAPAATRQPGDAVRNGKVRVGGSVLAPAEALAPVFSTWMGQR